MLCWAARASDVLITLLLLNDRGRFAHVNGDEHSFSGPLIQTQLFQSHRKVTQMFLLLDFTGLDFSDMKPCVPTEQLWLSRHHQTSFWWMQTTGWKCPPTPPMTFMRSVLVRADGFDLISDRLQHGPIWYAGPYAVRSAIAFANYCSRSRWAIIRVFMNLAT